MCESKFKKLYDKCKKKVKLKVLCLPVKLGALCKMVRGEMHDLTFIQLYLSPVKFDAFKACMFWEREDKCLCVAVLGQAGVNCNSMDASSPGVGEDMDAANAAAEEMDKNFEVNMQYKVR